MSHRAVLVTALLAVAVAVLLGLTVSPPASLSFVGGVVVGVASLAAVTLRVRVMTTGPQKGWRALAGLLMVPYYAVLVAALWALAKYYHQQAPWLVAGYLLVLTSFMLNLARRRRSGQSDCRAQ